MDLMNRSHSEGDFPLPAQVCAKGLFGHFSFSNRVLSIFAFARHSLDDHFFWLSPSPACLNLASSFFGRWDVPVSSI